MQKLQGLPQAPPDLDERLKLLWYEHAGKMNSGKLITFTQCLYALQRAEQARKMIDKQRLTVTTEKTGMKHLNPLLRVEKENRDVGLKLWFKLGLHVNSQPLR